MSATTSSTAKKATRKAKTKAVRQPKPSAKSRTSTKPKPSAKSTARTTAAAKPKPSTRSKPSTPTTSGKVVLLSGGNPQIAKADGDAPVQAYIAAMPGWKRDIGKRLDALIVRTLPNVRKAVRWNSPFYGIEGQGWFLSYHCFTAYIKLAFLRGTSLRPLPPVESKDPNTRYFHIHEHDGLDEARLAKWFEQAAALPGDPLF